ncbi:MAG TPA: FKBP-type peptidyl-prolyl cis-trans isomerase [Telluria sp.]
MIRPLVFTALALAAAAAMAQAPATANTAQSASSVAEAQPAAAVEPALPPLEKIDHVVGKGAMATAGKTVRVHYTGWFYKPLATNQRGRKFDSSLDRGEPLEFPLGAGKVIKGWDQGVEGMKVGGKRTLIIPSHLAYGKKGAGGGVIPGDSDLIFDVELVGVK